MDDDSRRVESLVRDLERTIGDIDRRLTEVERTVAALAHVSGGTDRPGADGSLCPTRHTCVTSATCPTGAAPSRSRHAARVRRTNVRRARGRLLAARADRRLGPPARAGLCAGPRLRARLAGDVGSRRRGKPPHQRGLSRPGRRGGGVPADLGVGRALSTVVVQRRGSGPGAGDSADARRRPATTFTEPGVDRRARIDRHRARARRGHRCRDPVYRSDQSHSVSRRCGSVTARTGCCYVGRSRWSRT